MIRIKRKSANAADSDTLEKRPKVRLCPQNSFPASSISLA